MFKITEYAQRKERIKDKAQELLSSAGKPLTFPDGDDTIRLVFAGQYSAGKSSILKMLTGRTDIETGGGIVTQETHTYDWNGLKVIDTPGIHTKLRPDHDEIAYEAIASADMLVFVITNELFDDYIANHFRKLAIDKDKAGEMILIVNKMDRAAGGNSHAQQDIIREDLKKVLAPYSPDQLFLSFLDTDSYLDSLEETDEEYAKDLYERSGYDDFINNLNRFVETNRIFSNLTTALYIIEAQLDAAIIDCQPNSSDTDIGALEESFIQQKHILTGGRQHLEHEVRDIFLTASAQIREIGLNAANLICEGCQQEDVEIELDKAAEDAEKIIDDCQLNASEVIQSRFEEMGQDLEDLENSQFSRDLSFNLNKKFNTLPEGIQKMLSKAGIGFQKAGNEVVGKAYREGVAHNGLKLTSFAQGSVHKMVLNIGHKIGYKFKPWQAVKIAKKVAVGAHILGFLGIGLDVALQIKADRDDEKMREELRKCRQSIRGQFNEVADDLEKYAKTYITSTITDPLKEPISVLEDNIRIIRESRENRSQLCRDLEELQGECRQLIRDIHSADSVQFQ